MFRFLSLIIILCTIFFIGMIKTARSVDFERKEALQMYLVEDTMQTIKKSNYNKKEWSKHKNRSIASTSNNQKEFDELMKDDNDTLYFDKIDALKEK